MKKSLFAAAAGSDGGGGRVFQVVQEVFDKSVLEGGEEFESSSLGIGTQQKIVKLGNKHVGGSYRPVWADLGQLD